MSNAVADVSGTFQRQCSSPCTWLVILFSHICFTATAFDPFGSSPKQAGPDLLGSFLGSANVPGDPFLQATRSPSPTVHSDPFHMGKSVRIFWCV